jgi:UDP-N-acetylglucosamine diphosphorylase / glucose-1-phosphate thymidylyltransferase / UDP-N-acetylgalactosamine diphosphorylase / glucosamine-1-phosphate N-acetyltransferase / galactosamine-1-phosphate N-acetyltransferase
MKAVILAAGRSERLKPFTETRAKPMIRLAGKPMLEYCLRGLAVAGITDVLVVVHHKGETISSHFEHGARFGVSIEYVRQDPLDGIGAAIRRCEKQLAGDPFLLVYGDVLAMGNPVQAVLSQYTETGGAVASLSLPASSAEFGNVYLNQDMRITRLVEKPSNPQLSNYVFAGIYFLPATFLRTLSDANNDVLQAFQRLVEQGLFFGSLWDGGWIDITRPWQILDANRMVMSGWDRAEIHTSVKLEGDVHIEGPVHIEENVRIGAGSILKGPCYIGRDSYIGNNTLIREYTALGPESVVGYGTELKNCVLLGRSILGRLSYIGDSVIGERAHLGTGVTTVNQFDDGRPVPFETEEGVLLPGYSKLGAFIGDDVAIGARNVLAPGTRIRSGTRIEDLISVRTIL